MGFEGDIIMQMKGDWHGGTGLESHHNKKLSTLSVVLNQTNSALTLSMIPAPDTTAPLVEYYLANKLRSRAWCYFS